jgi:DNA modification methylase
MKNYLYSKERNEFQPVLDTELNRIAKVKLDRIYKEREKIRIPNRILNQWDYVALFHQNGDIEKANSLFIENDASLYDLSNRLNDLTSKEWLPETVTVFTQKGLGASSKDAQIEKLHPAPFSFQDVARLVRFFSKEGDLVLDPFSGVASTAKACACENRHSIGIELNSKYYDLGLKRIKIEVPDEFDYKSKQRLIHADSLDYIAEIEDNSVDFIITSPPYWNILETVDHKSKKRVTTNLDHKYSEDKKDLANIKDYPQFLDVLSSFFSNCSRILKKNKYMCIIVSDFRKKEKYYTFHTDLANEMEKKGSFKLKGIRILYQRHKGIYPYGYPFSFVPNIHHQNVLVFQNNK